MKERVSAFIDGELGPEHGAETLSEVSSNPNLAEVWHRYHLIGAAFRQEPIYYLNLSERVRATIDQEASPATVRPIRPVPAAPAAFPRWPALAVAASLLVAVLGFQILPDQSNQIPPATAAELTVASTKWETVQGVDEDILNEFLVEHGEFTPAFGMNGLASYAKFVSYDTAR